ncbi:dolichyl-phosphate-mannose-protein mannosyltransferase [Microbacteriaceae bacterium SG_E_30_P1]|uniref:Polyprenol-phosphate-mannose--protein mannosyltransferase n=1 Tax=Antiquaquibacter oligotrophicus TaxID=2880260 RepID=A0ABT6KMB8_9MICO|nr:phospholipid carrier-dependent glycosyltransferase [Antiquaquibacter oligotrophicus]MDH6180252.1 dolichyl-phosphate-mannose-protein mannosyltransferase [Antiquaquibacter oligotrophicus]UDF14001.1 phospholipid carrier-dependent glycosyltransferase [Antiquaquibacter oligotrophicus]
MTERAAFDEIVDAPPPAESPLRRVGSRLDDWWLRRSPAAQRAVRWAAPTLALLIAAVARLWNLGHPSELVFDETFYVKDAWTLANLGYEAQWPADADTAFNSGDADGFLRDPAFIVHPPLGKWIISLGMLVLGPENPIAWRLSTALVGIAAVVLLMVVAHVLFRSIALTSIAGFLMAIEGNAIVMSRVALLDNSVMFLAFLGVLFVLLDRRWSRVRLSAWIAAREKRDKSTDWGPALWWRPWLIAAGAAFGAAAAVKWSGLYFLAGFAIYTLVVDAIARRNAGIQLWGSGTAFKQAPVTFVLMVPIAVAVYLASWIGWFTSDGGYDRHWAESDGNAWTGGLSWVPLSLQSLWHFEVSVYNYHVGENRGHGYEANPLTWLLLIRPTSMWYQGANGGELGCDYDVCGASVTGIANPVIWWAATAAVLYLAYRLVRYREWKVGFILMGMAAGYLPWLLYLGRTVFQFYSIAFEPYMLLALTFVIGLILGSPDDDRDRRTSGLGIVAVFLGVALLVSIFFWPLWTGMQLNYDYLRLHWWLVTWR